MRIAAPNGGAPLTGETATLTVEATDQGGVAEIRLYHNGKLVAGDTRQIGLAAPAASPNPREFGIAAGNKRKSYMLAAGVTVLAAAGQEQVATEFKI